ncbi:MAG: SOS response-associated peptidase [Stackebrandtia sp.]
MCGRFVSKRSAADLATLFDADDFSGDVLRPSFNVAPMQRAPVVRMSKRAGGRVVDAARWGLVPSWSKDPGAGARMINARVETVASSPAYRAAFARRRCLVPADGWYEWRKLPGGGKQPYFMTAPQDGGPLVFAGLWERWGQGEEESLLTCTVLTRPALGRLETVHDRMPLLLTPDRHGAWLGETDGGNADDILAAPDAALLAELEIRPVGKAVGNVRNDGPHLIESVPELVEDPPKPPADEHPSLF